LLSIWTHPYKLGHKIFQKDQNTPNFYFKKNKKNLEDEILKVQGVKLRESEVHGGYFKTAGSSGGSCEVIPNTFSPYFKVLNFLLFFFQAFP
jgi:hypothetical protein